MSDNEAYFDSQRFRDEQDRDREHRRTARLAAIKAMHIVCEAIREAKEIPSGHLYAALMPHGCTLTMYEAIIGVVTRSGVVEKKGDLLVWKGAKA